MTNSVVYKLNQIKMGGRSINVESAIVLSAPPKREVFTKMGPTNLQELLLGDDTGEIQFTVWGETCDRFTVGDRLDISNAYVTTYKGKNSISVGKFGKVVKAI
jgi:replication factor A1